MERTADTTHLANQFTAPSRKPSVGGWGWAIFFLAWFGGLIGYFSLKDRDPRRANHVAKWGLIWTAIWLGAWFVLYIIVAALIVTNYGNFEGNY